MNYLNEENLYRLIKKLEKSMFYCDIFSRNSDGNDILLLHKALMALQQLVKLGIIEFNEEGFVIKNGNIKDKASE